MLPELPGEQPLPALGCSRVHAMHVCPMKKIGLALSGGGFRASLYHLGPVRFPRREDFAQCDPHHPRFGRQHHCAPSRALNWERYNASASEFDAAALELLDFVRLDIRNRITRRFPLTLALRWPRRCLGRSNRRLTRTGLLEDHYEKYLYGDASLSCSCPNARNCTFSPPT